MTICSSNQVAPLCYRPSQSILLLEKQVVKIGDSMSKLQSGPMLPPLLPVSVGLWRRSQGERDSAVTLQYHVFEAIPHTHIFISSSNQSRARVRIPPIYFLVSPHLAHVGLPVQLIWGFSLVFCRFCDGPCFYRVTSLANVSKEGRQPGILLMNKDKIQ
jgi:hypothetical protein